MADTLPKQYSACIEMKKRQLPVRLLFFTLLASGVLRGQLPAVDSMVDFSAIEQKGYSHLQTLRQNAAGGLTRTMASENFDVHFYRCQWQIDPAVRFIRGSVTCHFRITQSTNTISFDLSDSLTVDSIIYKGIPVSFQRPGNDVLQLLFPSVMAGGQIDTVSIYYSGVPRATASFNAFNQNSHSGIPIIFTISEPFGAKEWWPCKNGLTDKADSIDIFITCPAAYSGTSNGLRMSESVAGGNKTVYYKHRYPIAAYLVALSVTNYVTDTDSVQLNGKSMPVRMNAYPEHAAIYKNATNTARQCLPKFSSLLGEYPFSKEHYSQTECSMGGGMEHQTNTFIGGTWNQLIAHELGHHWFGDNVTCGSWQHIWLNEGFANYMQFIFVENFDTALIMPHLSYYQNLIVSQPDGSVFVPDTSNPARIFSNRLTYAKGGYVVHMLRGILGDTVFFKGLRQYMGDVAIKNKFAFTADLQRNLEQVSGLQLTSFFQKWVYGEGYPSYNAQWMQNSNNWVKVQLNQTTSHPSVSFYEMPVQLQFRNSTRDTIITVNHQQSGQIFWINPGFKADTMLIDPRYWILAKDRVTKKTAAFSNKENEIKVYPNPATDYLQVQLFNPSVPQLNLAIYNMAGQLVFTKQIKLVGRDELITVPVASFAKAMYVLKATGTSTAKTVKILIK